MKVDCFFVQQPDGEFKGECSVCAKVFSGELQASVKKFVDHRELRHETGGGVIRVIPRGAAA